jgi:hypothetical protein
MNFDTVTHCLGTIFIIFTAIGSIMMFVVMFLAASYADQRGENAILLVSSLIGQAGFTILGYEAIKCIMEDIRA